MYHVRTMTSSHLSKLRTVRSLKSGRKSVEILLLRTNKIIFRNNLVQSVRASVLKYRKTFGIRRKLLFIPQFALSELASLSTIDTLLHRSYLKTSCRNVHAIHYKLGKFSIKMFFFPLSKFKFQQMHQSLEASQVQEATWKMKAFEFW